MAAPVVPFRVDDHYDRDRASDGRSRFGAYLERHARSFREDGELTDDPAEFAAAVFLTAVPPIMSPGYVSVDMRVTRMGRHWGEDGRCALAFTLVSALPTVLERGMRREWRTWETVSLGGVRDWVPPDDNGRPVALPMLELRVPLPVGDLPSPRYRDGVPELATAKRAVVVLVGELNRRLEPVLSGLTAAGVA
ncbi:hypothetical protein [Actinosynnema sp. NPDC023587]|uniref:hypothetical protein n=1 Tax=Actinosynnema sp. NPDC023587 TaxID=3154695 RepID=UPI00340804E7